MQPVMSLTLPHTLSLTEVNTDFVDLTRNGVFANPLWDGGGMRDVYKEYHDSYDLFSQYMYEHVSKAICSFKSYGISGTT